MRTTILFAALAMVAATAVAKIPPPVLDDAAKVKAAETAAKTAWQAKVDNYLLCKSQDKVAARYRATAGKSAPAPTPVVAPTVSAASAAAAGTATPTPVVAMAPLPACSDPGPFAFTPPEQKPLEAAGAHSPAGTATSPPSTNKPAAEMKPVEKKKS